MGGDQPEPGVFRLGFETPLHPFARRRLIAGPNVKSAEGLQRIELARIELQRSLERRPRRRRVLPEHLEITQLSLHGGRFGIICGEKFERLLGRARVAFREGRAGRHQVSLGIGGLQLQGFL